jgi:ABC-type lipoprotein export system ATPase subunit
MPDPVLAFQDVSMSYPTPDRQGRQVLRSVSFELPERAAVALVGRSGSGKSTLLHLAAGISTATSGRVLLGDTDLSRGSETDRTALRRQKIGLVFQFFHLLQHLSILENVAVPGWIAADDGSRTQSRARELLERVGLFDRRDDPVGKLSGGEMQRVALCRALLRRPALILADEPTGSLDDKTGRDVLELLLQLVRDEGSSLLLVTHSHELATCADQVWQLQDGRLDTGSAT